MVLSKSVVRSVAQFRIRGHGLRCVIVFTAGVRTGACVCNLCDEKHVPFSCMGTEHLRHQFTHLFDNISEGDI
jgi:hypothetical protein